MTAEPPARPADIDTGFWLWVTALALLSVGYVGDLVAGPRPSHATIVYMFSGVTLVVIVALVATFLLLMRQGYRWARTLLTSGGIASVVYVISSLFTVDRPPVAALVYAVTGIVGSVCIVGGIYLLHRADSHAYFTR